MAHCLLQQSAFKARKVPFEKGCRKPGQGSWGDLGQATKGPGLPRAVPVLALRETPQFWEHQVADLPNLGRQWVLEP